MKLYVVQHGLALSKTENPDRPLSEQGINDVKKIAQFLGNAGITVEQLYHSGKTRAQQTAAILQKNLGTREIQILHGIEPNDSVTSLGISLDPLISDTLIVGHLPFVSKLVSHLVCGTTDRETVQYQPGSIVCLEQYTESWKIAWMLRPDLLNQ